MVYLFDIASSSTAHCTRYVHSDLVDIAAAATAQYPRWLDPGQAQAPTRLMSCHVLVFSNGFCRTHQYSIRFEWLLSYSQRGQRPAGPGQAQAPCCRLRMARCTRDAFNRSSTSPLLISSSGQAQTGTGTGSTAELSCGRRSSSNSPCCARDVYRDSSLTMPLLTEDTAPTWLVCSYGRCRTWAGMSSCGGRG